MPGSGGLRTRRVVAQVAAFALVAGLGVLLPRPVIALEREMVTETITPDLARAAAPTAGTSGVAPPLAGTESEVEEFNLIGLEYDSPSEGAARVRAHEPDGTWTPWVEVEVEANEGPDPDTGENHNPTTAPVWVGEADGFSIEVPADSTGVRVHVVREGEQQVRVDVDESEAGASHAEGVPLPPVHTRSSWGARGARDTPTYSSRLVRAIVHHTVNSNGYSSGAVPGMLRSIQAYHMDANGWDDIGYNFVVDRFGRLWEGRGGGIRRNVVGAHARNYNSTSVGISFLGDFTGASPAAGAVQIAQHMAAWKLQRNAASSSAVVGHRDVGQTSCPGAGLYARLGGMRTAVAQWRTRYPYRPHTAPVLPPPSAYPGDYNGDGFDDVFVYGPGSQADALRFGQADGAFQNGPAVPVAGTGYRPVVGDFDDDGRADVLFYAPGAAQDWIWWGNAPGSPAPFTHTQVAVNGTTYQLRVGDFDGAGGDDVLWYAPGQAADYLWYGQTDRTYQTIGLTLNATDHRPLVADFNGDSRSDIFFYRPNANADAVWYGNADHNNPFTGVGVSVSSDYGTLVGDFDGDSFADVFWYRPGTAPDFVWYGSSDTNNPFGHVQVSVSGSYAGAPRGDFNDDGRDDILWYAPGSQTDYLWEGNADRNAPFGGQGASISGSYVPHVADYNGDHDDGTPNVGGQDILWFGPGSRPDGMFLGNSGGDPFGFGSPGSL